MSRKWIIAVFAALICGVSSANLTAANAQSPKPSAMAAPTKVKKALPPRDAKGRFMKKPMASPAAPKP